MRLQFTTLGALILALPVTVEVPNDSTRGRGGETRVTVIGSTGRYAIIDRGCEGQVIDTHPVDFREAAASIEHRLSNGMTFGLRGSLVRDEAETDVVVDYSSYPYRESLVVVRFDNAYLNPWLGAELRSLGVGVGFVWLRENTWINRGNPSQFSFHTRFGSLETMHFKVSHMENVPMYAGGGSTEIGLGIHPRRRWDVWVGLSGGMPYDGVGLGFEVDYRLLTHWALASRVRLGHSGGEPQNG